MKITKCYKVVVSSGDPVQIDPDEIDKLLESMSKGGVVVFRRGIVNTSYVTSVIPDIERHAEWIRDCNYSDGSGEKAKQEGMMPLRSIWEGTGTKIEKLVEEAWENALNAQPTKVIGSPPPRLPYKDEK